MTPSYDFDKIKFATDKPTLERAIKLYEDKKVTKFQENPGDYSAIVIGTKPYTVFVSTRDYDHGRCNCYLGQNNTLCKHMIAVAIYSLFRGKPLSDSHKEFNTTPKCSNKKGELSKSKLLKVKKEITSLLRYIKPYRGPSRIWFEYQDSLSEGCNRLSALVCKLPASKQTSEILVNLLIRLDKKLCTGGVDDSDGTVGGFIENTVKVLEEYAKLDPECIQAFDKLINRKTCFGWEEELVKLYDEM
jgi:hypothetical protein